MPKSSRWYQMKTPHLQIKILKLIALAGRSSQKEAISYFKCRPPTISEAFKVLLRRKLILETDAPEFEKFENRVRGVKSYKLSSHGLLAFIDENPSPQEFWIAIIWYYSLNPKYVDKTEFNRYYSLFIDKFIGNFPLRSCFFMGNFFEELFQKWCRRFDYEYYHSKSLRPGYMYYEARKANKVLECLLLNRGIMIGKIIELTQLTEQEIRKVLKDYSITQSSYYQYSEYYESVYQSSRSIDVTTDLLNHLLIVPTARKKEGEKGNDGQDEKYELSLLGILLILATMSLLRQRRERSYSVSYYSRIALNYREKLPLIFGKWELLKNILNFDAYPSTFDYLLSNHKPEILSLSVSLGGNKEIYDNIRSATLGIINKLFTLYDEGGSALQSSDYPEKFVNSKHYRLIKEKIDEVEISLKYADLESFARYMKNKERNFHLDDDLHIIESAIADEFTFMFYVGLLRDNNHTASDYPLTTGFLRPSPNLVYPKWYLMNILRKDKDIRNRLAEWVNEALSYQKQTTEKMNEIYAEIRMNNK